MLGRFVSADTIVPGAGNPQAINRFSYIILGNPLKYTDSSGHVPILLLAALVVGALVLTSDVAHVPQSWLGTQRSVDSIAATATSAGQALVTLFTSDAMPGNTPQTRMDSIIDGTVDSSGSQFRVDFGSGGIQAQYDDSRLDGGGNPVGHFLQAATMSYYSGNSASDYVNLGLIVGHEMFPDFGASSGGRTIIHSIQGVVGLANPRAIDLFLEGNDQSLGAVLDAGDYWGDVRRGNSIQDLRSSYQGWRFGKVIRRGQFPSNFDAANWLEDYFAEIDFGDRR